MISSFAMPESVSITIPDPQCDIHIGELTFLHITIQNIDTEVVTLKELQFRPDAGIWFDNPTAKNNRGVVSKLDGVSHSGEPPGVGDRTLSSKIGHLLKISTEATVYDGITFNKDKTLEPGNQVSFTFPFKPGGLLRKNLEAGKYSLVFTLKYQKGTDDKSPVYSKVETKNITIYNSMKRMLLGGIIGGLIGIFFRVFNDLGKLSRTTLIEDFVLGAVIGFMIVVILNRKSSVQSFVSVNDFWGGLLAGFIAGAGGQQFLSPYLNANTSAAASNVAAIVTTVTPAI